MRNGTTAHPIRKHPLFDGYKRHVLMPGDGLHCGSCRRLLFVDTLSALWGCVAPDDQNGKIVWAMCLAEAQDP
jgi:hypothetical protein